MKRIIVIISTTVLFFLVESCASIFSTSTYPVHFQSTPDKASVKITDRNGVEVYLGETPAVVPLKASAGFFKKAIYNIKISKDGYTPKTYTISASLDGWYWGNILIGGWIGMLIVDPATGAMFQIKETSIDAILSEETANSKGNKQELRIYDISEIPESWKENLVRIDNLTD